MRKPKDKSRQEVKKKGGRAAERLRQFNQERGLEPDEGILDSHEVDSTDEEGEKKESDAEKTDTNQLDESDNST